MSNAKSRYYEAVDASQEDPEMIGHIHTIHRGTPKIDWFDGEEWNGHPEKWLRPMPPDAVVISGEELTLMKVIIAQLRPRPSRYNYHDLEDARVNILSILNRSQQKEEK